MRILREKSGWPRSNITLQEAKVTMIKKLKKFCRSQAPNTRVNPSVESVKIISQLKIVPLDGAHEFRREDENVGKNDIILGVDVVADNTEGHNALIDYGANDGLDSGSGPSLVSVHCKSDNVDSLDAIFGLDFDKPVKKEIVKVEGPRDPELVKIELEERVLFCLKLIRRFWT